MADLSFDDVRRAAENAVNNLQNAVNDIRTNVQYNRNDLQRLNPNDFQSRMLNLQRALDNLLQYLQRIDVYLQNNQNSAVLHQQTNQVVQRLEQRLVNTEHIAAETNKYLEVIHQQMVQLSDLHAQFLSSPEP